MAEHWSRKPGVVSSNLTGGSPFENYAPRTVSLKKREGYLGQESNQACVINGTQTSSVFFLGIKEQVKESFLFGRVAGECPISVDGGLTSYGNEPTHFTSN